MDMSDTLDLKTIEKKAFRSVHQDGLWDIVIGGIVLSYSALAYSTDSEAFPLLRFGLFLVGLCVFELIFWGGKKYVTIPRLGLVKFGPRRKRRMLTMTIVLGAIVLVQVVILVGSILAWRNPGWAASLGLVSSNPDFERLLVAFIGAMFVGPSMVMIAYFNEFMRGYYIAVILSLAVFSLIWFGQPIYLVISALIIMIPGVVLFVRFLHAYPLPPAEVSHD
jgi:hypothetical protein